MDLGPQTKTSLRKLETRAHNGNDHGRSKNTELYVDASPFGLGAILTQTTPGQQDTKVIAYASRLLTDTESRYSQIEHESLAIVSVIEHFHIYLYGHEFTLITDHKPLELIYRNPKSRPSARLERWCLRLQDYTFQVKYRPEPANPSDYLSRHPLTTRPDNKQQNLSDEHVRCVVNHAVPVALDVNTIRRATQDDPTCQKLIELLRNNSWNSLNTNNLHPEINTAELRAYELLKHELSLTPEADLIIRGNRLVIPTKLRQQVICLAHQGHQGLIESKKLLREKVWFPKIDTLIEKAVKECFACQSVGQPSTPAPIQPMPIPQQAWDVIYVDFLGPLPTKDLLLAIIVGRTRYPEVEIVRNTSAKSTIQCFESIFSRHGIPHCIRQWSTVPGRRNSPIYVYKWYQTPQNYANMATSKRRSRDVHETANEVSTDGSRRTHGLETRATTISDELPRHAQLYNKSTACHSTVRTKHTHQVTREVFESKHGRDRQEDQRT